jgi:hypothetical protein
LWEQVPVIRFDRERLESVVRCESCGAEQTVTNRNLRAGRAACCEPELNRTYIAQLTREEALAHAHADTQSGKGMPDAEMDALIDRLKADPDAWVRDIREPVGTVTGCLNARQNVMRQLLLRGIATEYANARTDDGRYTFELRRKSEVAADA